MDMGIKYPTDVTVDERVRRFVERFYELSDDGTRDGEWVGCFAGDALLVMGNRRGKGVDGRFFIPSFFFFCCLWL